MGLLRDCETLNFANVRFQLYLTTLLSVLSVPRSQLGSNWREMRFKVCSIQRGKIVSTKPPPLSIKCVSYYLFVLRQYKVFSAVFGEKVKSWELTRAIAANVAPLLCWGNITRARTSKQLWSATAFNQQLLYTWRHETCVLGTLYHNSSYNIHNCSLLMLKDIFLWIYIRLNVDWHFLKELYIRWNP